MKAIGEKKKVDLTFRKRDPNRNLARQYDDKRDFKSQILNPSFTINHIYLSEKIGLFSNFVSNFWSRKTGLLWKCHNQKLSIKGRRSRAMYSWAMRRLTVGTHQLSGILNHWTPGRAQPDTGGQSDWHTLRYHTIRMVQKALNRMRIFFAKCLSRTRPCWNTQQWRYFYHTAGTQLCKNNILIGF